MISALALYEPSTCDCPPCRQFCRSGRPGCLAPSDIDHIAEYLGLDEASGAFIEKTFRACADGPGTASDEFPDGATPAMRPATRGNGECVFLSEEGRCTIHAVAPFECRQTQACDPSAGAGAMKALGKAIRNSADYVQTWLWLWKRQGGPSAS